MIKNISNLGDAALYCDFGSEVNKEINSKVIRYFKSIQKENIDGINNLTPSYNKLIISFDLRKKNFQTIKKLIENLNITNDDELETNKIKIPVCCDENFSLDIKRLEEKLQITRDKIYEKFFGKEFFCYMTGFIAGMPFLGDLENELQAKRLETPRVKVPKGSVGLTEQFANVYTFESPGGWNIIGNTPQVIFDSTNENNPNLINPGDVVTFEQITKDNITITMNKNYFEIKRAGINTTFQDQGRGNLYHIGIPFSGAMDNRNFQISNKLVGNEVNFPIIEFAYQGPLLKYFGENINFAITGDVKFIIRKKNNAIEGKCYQSFTLENGDELDIISTNKSVYGYLAVSGEFDVNYQWSSCSVNTKANIGANNGKKIEDGQKIYILNINKNLSDKKLNYINTKIENIRVIQGTNFDYFSDEGKKIFFEKEFVISKLSDRMGMRLEGPKIENIVDTNIKSEGLLKGVIQVPADGNPIIMLSDHGTIGGYPKIGVVISADYDKLVQLTPGSKIKFKKVELADAETLFKLYDLETQNLISQI